MAGKIMEQIHEESNTTRESHSITAEYDIEIPRSYIEEAHDEYGHDDTALRCAKAVARRKFKEDHDVPFNTPTLVAEPDGSGIDPEDRRFTVVAIK